MSRVQKGKSNNLIQVEL